MIHIDVDCIRFGPLGITGAPHGAFDVLRLGPCSEATIVARIEVEHTHPPSLRSTPIEAQQLFVDSHSSAQIDRVVLARWRDDAPSHFELSAVHKHDGVEIVLSGDCRHRLFHQCVQFRDAGGELETHGPFHARDLDT